MLARHRTELFQLNENNNTNILTLDCVCVCRQRHINAKPIQYFAFHLFRSLNSEPGQDLDENQIQAAEQCNGTVGISNYDANYEGTINLHNFCNMQQKPGGGA